MLFCLCFLCERILVKTLFFFRLKFSLSLVFFCCVDAFFFVVLVLNIFSIEQEEQKCLLSFFSRPLLNTRVYIFLINSLSKVVFVVLLQSYDDGRRIFVNKLGSL